jgi:hypothetical protein
MGRTEFIDASVDSYCGWGEHLGFSREQAQGSAIKQTSSYRSA